MALFLLVKGNGAFHGAAIQQAFVYGEVESVLLVSCPDSRESAVLIEYEPEGHIVWVVLSVEYNIVCKDAAGVQCHRVGLRESDLFHSVSIETSQEKSSALFRSNKIRVLSKMRLTKQRPVLC